MFSNVMNAKLEARPTGEGGRPWAPFRNRGHDGPRNRENPAAGTPPLPVEGRSAPGSYKNNVLLQREAML